MKPLLAKLFVLALCIAVMPSLDAQIQQAKPTNLAEVLALIQWPQQYPANYEAGHVSCGWTVVRIQVNEQGEYLRHVLVSSDDPAIADSVRKHLHLLRFAPALEGQKAVESWLELPIYLQNPKDFVEPQAPLPLNLQEVKDSIRTRVGTLHDAPQKVVAKVLVGADGNPKEVLIVKSSFEVLSRIVSEEANRLRFEPGILCGRPCEQWCLIPFILE
jgi:outer membrane biosynthesis protein TonB